MARITITEHRKIMDVGNVYVDGQRCSAAIALYINSNLGNAYCIKASSQGDEGAKVPVVCHKFANFITENSTTKCYTIHHKSGSNVNNVAKHANSLTYEGYYYLVTGNSIGDSQVVGFKLKGDDPGIIAKSYTYTHRITSINHFETINGTKYFLVCVGANETEHYYRFHKVHISGNEFIYDNIQFKVYFSAEYDNGNDSFYDKENQKLYVTRFKTRNDNRIIENAIFQYDLSEGISGTTATYQPERILKVDADDEYKFEVEGMGIYKIDENRSRKYVFANIVDNEGAEGTDAVYWIVGTDT